MKPSTDTLVTLHMDYDPGSMLGKVLEQDTTTLGNRICPKFECTGKRRNDMEVSLT